MFFVILLVVLPALSRGAWLWDTDCGFTRDDSLACIERHVDTNHDGKVTAAEVEEARHRYGGKTLAFVQWLISWFKIDISTEKIMKDCGADKDGIMTKEGWEKSAETCLPNPWGRCQLKKVCDYADGKKRREGKQ